MGIAALVNLPDSALKDYLAKTELITFTPGTITEKAEFIKETQMKFSGVSPAAATNAARLIEKETILLFGVNTG